MSKFRTEELISISDVVLVLVTTAIILLLVYLFLLKIRPSISRHSKSKPENGIELLEIRSFPSLGSVAIIAIHDERFVVVQTKNGVTTTPLQSKLKNADI